MDLKMIEFYHCFLERSHTVSIELSTKLQPRLNLFKHRASGPLNTNNQEHKTMEFIY